jgi:hypothetical protein
VIRDCVTDHNQGADTNHGRNQCEKELEADAKAQAEPADFLLTELIAQVGNAQGVFVFEVPFLDLQKLRLVGQELNRLARDLGILSRRNGRDRCSERFRACKRLLSLYFGFLVLAS